METNTTRRALLKVAPIAATLAIVPTQAIAATSADSAILEAWNRRQEAYAAFDALPKEQWGCTATTPEEARLWSIIDATEEVIRSTVAQTPQGVAIQIWTALTHNMTDREDEKALIRADLPYFNKRCPDLDWGERLAIAALRSLNAMEA